METYQATTGHQLNLVHASILPAFFGSADKYKSIYEVRNGDPTTGFLFMYVCTGCTIAPKEVHVFYPNGQMWSSFGKSIGEAIEGAIKDGWKYAN